MRSLPNGSSRAAFFSPMMERWAGISIAIHDGFAADARPPRRVLSPRRHGIARPPAAISSRARSLAQHPCVLCVDRDRSSRLGLADAHTSWVRAGSENPRAPG